MTRIISLAALVAAALASIASARPTPDTFAVHEKRDAVHRRWSNPVRVRSDDVVYVKIGLKQSNLHLGHDLLMDVSDPNSPNYGKFWTEEEVIQKFAPSDDSVDAVKDWLASSGIHNARITHTDNKGWLVFIASSEELENLVHADYYKYEDVETGNMAITTDKYHVPSHITEHIDYITPGVRFPFFESMKMKRANNEPYNSVKGPMRNPAPSPTEDDMSAASGTSNCAASIIPDCITALYQIPEVTGTPSPNNSLGIFESQDNYMQSELDSNFAMYPYLGIPKGTHPTLVSIDGGTVNDELYDKGESDLDFTLAFPIVYPQSITLFQNGDPREGGGKGLFNTFLDAIDGSYCTSCYAGECGDDLEYDGIYPDPNGGYEGQLMCGTYQPTNVISFSYGNPESYVPESYFERQCNEFMKLGLRGVSLVFASGDSGVAGRFDTCLGDSQNVFNPGWPATCPYITTVGATTIPDNGSIAGGEVVANDPINDPFGAAFSSGGGFSNVFPIPDYQASAVASYFANHDPSYPYYNGTVLGEGGGLYNRSGRGFPDVSAVGDKFYIYTGGGYSRSAGTSASAPIFASIINRIIDERIAAGKTGPLGFLNPALYQNPSAFNDITSGSNPGCNTNGFSAVSGWDPASGLGTPNYPKLRDALVAL